MFTKTKNPINNIISSKLEASVLLYKVAVGVDKIVAMGQATEFSNAVSAHDTASLQLNNNTLILQGRSNLSAVDRSNLSTKQTLLRNKMIGSYAPFVKTLIIRGIGYQASLVENDSSNAVSKEFPYDRYLSLRVGHSFHVYKPIPDYIGVKVAHKDRKLVIYGSSKEQVANYAKIIFKLRLPSVYTGRGIRIKKENHRRKLGKKDIRKGKV